MQNPNPRVSPLAGRVLVQVQVNNRDTMELPLGTPSSAPTRKKRSQRLLESKTLKTID